MPRAATTLDPFNAIAEPKRREVLDALAKASAAGNPEVPVNDLVNLLQWPQPQVSKHLAVLREVGIVAVRRRGRERLYSIDGEGLKSIHDWTAMFDRFWTHNRDPTNRHPEAVARAAASGPAPLPVHPLLNIPSPRSPRTPEH
ncbi:MAG TPA: metalloregulator ArsR/SmtB family transcription factor [Phycisphaerales bacterium]|nr:metalloregulator ArsR/SmtB family transcription factor [Phycisphaerales bacterium]